jgi:hypothetical protein
MSEVDSLRVIRYRASTPEEALRAFDEDRERARAFGFVPLGSAWDQGEAQATLVVEYRYDSRGLPTTTASRDEGVDHRAPSGRPDGLARAILIVGVILGGLVLLAVSIPAAAPHATSAPVASSVPSSTARSLPSAAS